MYVFCCHLPNKSGCYTLLRGFPEASLSLSPSSPEPSGCRGPCGCRSRPRAPRRRCPSPLLSAQKSGLLHFGLLFAGLSWLWLVSCLSFVLFFGRVLVGGQGLGEPPAADALKARFQAAAEAIKRPHQRGGRAVHLPQKHRRGAEHEKGQGLGRTEQLTDGSHRHCPKKSPLDMGGQIFDLQHSQFLKMQVGPVPSPTNPSSHQFFTRDH